MLNNYDIKKVMEWPINVQVILFIFLIFTLVLFFSVYEYISFNRMKAFYRASEVQLLNDYKASLENQVVAKNDLQKYSQAKNKLNKFSQEIVSQNQLQEILNNIFKKGENLGLKFSSFETQNMTAKEEIPYSSVKMELLGNYDQLASFLSDMANMNYLILISEFNFNQANTSGQLASILKNSLIKANLTLNIYEKAA